MSSRLGLYVHIPFCQSKCSYCHFASGVFPESLIKPYFGALRREMETLPALLQRWSADGNSVSDWVIDTIFVGGGTPSLVNEREIGQVLDWIRERVRPCSCPGDHPGSESRHLDG